MRCRWAPISPEPLSPTRSRTTSTTSCSSPGLRSASGGRWRCARSGSPGPSWAWPSSAGRRGRHLDGALRERPQRALSQHRRRSVARVVPGELRGADPARALQDREHPGEPLARRRDRGAVRHRVRVRIRLRADRQCHLGHHGRRGHQPGLPARRLHPPRGDRGRLRAVRLAARPRLDHPRGRPCPECARGRHLSRPDRSGHLRRGLASRRVLARLFAAGGPRGVAAGKARGRAAGRGPARGPDALRLRRRRRRTADAGPLQPAPHRRARPHHGHRAARAHPHRARVPRQPADDRAQPRGSPHRSAHRTSQPAQPDGGPRRGTAAGHRGAAGAR